MKRLVITTMLLLLAASPALAQDKDITITLIPGLTTDPFYITMNQGAQAAAEALGITVNFQGAAEFNPTLQVPVLNAVMGRQPDAILIAPTDSTQLIAPLKRASQMGIPIITLDTFIGDGQYQDGQGEADFPKSYIASDNVEGGRIAARAMAEAIGEEGSVYVSSVRPGISSTDQREQGFKEEMQNYPNITVLETQYNDNDASTAAAQLQAVLAREPDLAGVFGANLFSAIGAANGVRAAGLSDEITVVAFDTPPSIVNSIESGLVDIAIAQHPAAIGYFGVMTAYAVVTGQSVPPIISTSFTILNESNYQDPDMQQFIYSN